MALPTRERKYRLEEYLALDERCPERLEYNGGYVWPMAGEHNDIMTKPLLALTPPAGPIRQQNVKLRVSSPKYPYPDLMILCGPRPSDPRMETDPCLMAEVLSPTAARGQSSTPTSSFRRWRISPEERLGGYISALRDPGEIAIPCIEALLSPGAIYTDLE